MSTVGIIAEFNPLHNGHRFLLQRAKEITGADCAVVIMSGDFVQRGAPAICDKYLRTETALNNGADIVFELPVKYATGSAETFADGAVRLLVATASVDFLVFGSECGDIDMLTSAAGLMNALEDCDEYHSLLSKYIRSGMSFPAARAEAVKVLRNIGCNREDFPEVTLSCEHLDSVLSQSNNILALEYLRVLLRLKKTGCKKLPVPMTVRREGQDYNDTAITSCYPSASAIRKYLLESEELQGTDIESCMPQNMVGLLLDSYGRCLPVTEDDFSSLFYMRLNTMDDKTLLSIPDINPDLLNSILKHRFGPLKISELVSSVKNKAFTYTAVSRAIFKILLSPVNTSFGGISCTKTVNIGAAEILSPSENKKPYLRLLGFNRAYSHVLRGIQDEGGCTLITKPADADRSDEGILQDFAASAIYSQVLYSKFGYLRAEELRQTPRIIG